MENRRPPGDQSDGSLIDPQILEVNPWDTVLVAENPGSVFAGDIPKL